MSDVRTAELSRRRLLQIVVGGRARRAPDRRCACPRPAPSPLPRSLDAETLTLEAWSDTMVPGEKRSAGDRAIAGATAGPGAVQAGAVDMMRFGPVGLAPALPALAAGMNAEAIRYAADRRGAARPDRARRSWGCPSSTAPGWRSSCSTTPPRPARLVRPGRDRDARVPHRRPPAHGGRRPLRAPRPGLDRLPARRTPTGSGAIRSSPTAARSPTSHPAHHAHRAARMSVETTDVVVIGTGFGGAIPAYNLAAGGASVVMLERGPEVATEDFAHDLQVGTYTRYRRPDQRRRGPGGRRQLRRRLERRLLRRLAARAVLRLRPARAPPGRRLWPAALTRAELDPWYDRVEETLPVAQQTWDDVPYAGRRAGRPRAATPGTPATRCRVAVDLPRCTNCNWMLSGCRFDAKRSMLLNYLPAARAHGAEIRPLHEVQPIGPATDPRLPLPRRLHRRRPVATTG